MTDLRVGDVVTADLDMYPESEGTKALRTYVFDYGNLFTVDCIVGEEDKVSYVCLRELGYGVFRTERFKRINAQINVTESDLQELLDG